MTTPSRPIRRSESPIRCVESVDSFTVVAPISGDVDPGLIYFDFRDLEGKVMRWFCLSAGDRVEVTFRKWAAKGLED